MDSEERFLPLLAICHYVVGAAAMIAALLAVQVLLLGTALLTGSYNLQELPYSQWLLGIELVWGALLAMLFGFALSVALVRAGNCLRQRDRFRFCQITAAVGCIFFPFGTLLGAVTLVFLGRPSVRRLFDESGYPNQSGEGS